MIPIWIRSSRRPLNRACDLRFVLRPPFAPVELFCSYLLPVLAALFLGTTWLAAAAWPVPDGLFLRLDTAGQNDVRRAADLPPLAQGTPVARWLDTDGKPWGASQLRLESRPILRVGEAAAFLRFDGKDDFLPVAGPARSIEAMTVFVLAAPKANPGFFTALFSTAEPGKNDYTSGLNLDFGPAATEKLSVINVESAGSVGFRDLFEPSGQLFADLPFEGFHVFTVRTRPGERGTELFVDSIHQGARERASSQIGLHELMIGARLYSNDPTQAPFAQGFFRGDLAAVLVYDRALDDGEREEVEQSLFARAPALNALASGRAGHALEILDDPPLVQMLVPGFTVRELPLDLRNQNNVRYRHDGKLVALGYDGRIHLVTDEDGDGLEETALVFWDKAPLRGPIGMALLPKNDPRGDGLFVASKAKLSLILDRDRDGVAEEELVVASGWKETFHGVDTLGVAMDPRDGSVYFSIGCENFANAYLIDPATGRSNFDLAGERGTIQRVSPDLSTRETVATGVRFACALAFNRHGDLFATDQEGATWLPNGNPLDELLHIVRGRHFGFPPRHPRHLPQVIDEPPVMEYGPQHQSTVGLVFNEGVNGGSAFGPAHWEGDALICGESRGKLYRTQLVKTDLGYVAQNHLIACLNLLTVDACVTPRGDLLVACHSGPPDWGTGPAGPGRLFQIRYERRDVPQPVAAWASTPDEFRVAFDRALDARDWARAKEKVRIEAGPHVQPGDRYESIRPGYQVVRDQMTAPRRWIDVESLGLSEDRRTLVLRVPRQNLAETYAVTLPVPPGWMPEKGINQHANMDVAVSLHGLVAEWPGDHDANTTMVIPHPGPSVARRLTKGSAEHERFFDSLQAGAAENRALRLSGRIDVSNLFIPATQPGAKLDWDTPQDSFFNRTMTVRQDFTDKFPQDVPPRNGDPDLPMHKAFELSVEGTLNLDGGGLFYSLDDRVRPIPTRRLLLPWATGGASADLPSDSSVRDDVHGDWLRGRRLFFGQGACATCHTIHGQGTPFGPDLSNLIHRDRASVTQDILQPSATINPDHTGTRVILKDGESHDGLIQKLTDDEVELRQAAGVRKKWPRRQVANLEAMTASLMPDNIGEAMREEDLEDLLTFLLTSSLEPAAITRLEPPAPPARHMEEILHVIGSISTAPATEPGPLNILLCAGHKDHGPDEHDYPLWLERWAKLLAIGSRITVQTSMGFPSEAQLQNADVAVFYNANPGWDREKASAMDAFHERGGGAVYLHYAVAGGSDPEAMAERCGLAFALGSRFRHGEMDLVFTQPDHPITRGFPTLHFTDETYWNMRGNLERLRILGNVVEENEPRPQLWTLERHGARIVGCIPGHYTWTFDDPLFRVLVLRGICWAAKQGDVDRLAELATVGARMAP